MDSVRNWMILAVATAVAATPLAGCQDETAPASVAPSSPSAEAPAPPTARPLPGDLERSDDGAIRYVGTTEGGERFSAQLGGEVRIPDTVTEQIPLYPGAVPFSAMEAASTIMVTLDSPDPAAEIYAFYTRRLPEDGWTVENDLNVARQRIVTAVRGDKKIVLQIDGTKAGSRIAIVINDAV